MTHGRPYGFLRPATQGSWNLRVFPYQHWVEANSKPEDSIPYVRAGLAEQLEMQQPGADTWCQRWNYRLPTSRRTLDRGFDPEVHCVVRTSQAPAILVPRP